MKTDQTKSYPLIYARVGSIVKNGKIPLMNVLTKPITVFNYGGKGNTYMSGQSRYTKTEEMNKGSFGISGSYGISGIAKVGFSASGYLGNAVARSGKSVNVNYNAYLSAGVERIKVEQLSVEDLINSLSDNPKRMITSVLERYLELYKAINNTKVKPHDILNSKAIKDTFNRWGQSLETFYQKYGDGLVVAIHWGAFGSVQMQLTNKTDANSWKYGANAEFSYAGIGGGTSVKTTYAGSQASSDAEVGVQVNSDFTGNAIRQLIDSWRNVVEGKAFKEIAEVNMIASVPSLEVPKDINPTVTEFKKPEKEKKLTDKISQIKDLNGLNALAKAQAYEKQKENRPNLTLEQFLNQADQQASGEGIPESEEEFSSGLLRVIEEDDSVETDISVDARSTDVQDQTMMVESKIVAIQNAEGNIEKNFVPMGLLVCNWSDIFPWLSRGTFNNIEDLGPVKHIFQWREMIQDFQTLTILYYTCAGANISIGLESSPEQIADSFSQMASNLQDSDDSTYLKKIHRAFRGLSPVAQRIYKVWLKASFLRNAELGLGYINTLYQPQSSINNISSESSILPKTMSSVSFVACDFNTESKNYSSFAEMVKVFPIITTDGSIRVFTYAGLLGQFQKKGSMDKQNYLGFYPALNEDSTYKGTPPTFITKYTDSFESISFDVIKSEKCLENKKRNIKLYPIPLSAAKNVGRWLGPAAGSTSLSSFEDLTTNLKSLKNRLSQLKAWSFVGTPFKSLDLSNGLTLGEIGLSDLTPPTHYIGIVPEQKDVMSLY